MLLLFEYVYNIRYAPLNDSSHDKYDPNVPPQRMLSRTETQSQPRRELDRHTTKPKSGTHLVVNVKNI